MARSTTCFRRHVPYRLFFLWGGLTVVSVTSLLHGWQNVPPWSALGIGLTAALVVVKVDWFHVGRALVHGQRWLYQSRLTSERHAKNHPQNRAQWERVVATVRRQTMEADDWSAAVVVVDEEEPSNTNSNAETRKTATWSVPEGMFRAELAETSPKDPSQNGRNNNSETTTAMTESSSYFDVTLRPMMGLEGFTLEGTRSACSDSKDKDHFSTMMITEGFVSRLSRKSYWVERNMVNGEEGILVVGTFPVTSGLFQGEWLSSDARRGTYLFVEGPLPIKDALPSDKKDGEEEGQQV